MKHFRAVAIELLAFAVVGVAVTQTGHGLATAVRVPAEPKGSPQIEKMLRAFEGTWLIKEKFAPDAGSPNGATAGGQIVWRAGPGRFSVIEEYRSKRESAEVTGLGVFWWMKRRRATARFGAKVRIREAALALRMLRAGKGSSWC